MAPEELARNIGQINTAMRYQCGVIKDIRRMQEETSRMIVDLHTEHSKTRLMVEQQRLGWRVLLFFGTLIATGASALVWGVLQTTIST